ncbi:hypothetical protein ACFZCF_14380 [Streptomyces sp. NPDC007945]|uniref:hypothetical protein n=1 Tax=Streptomyces sp. NPDC007945 TaxID=3364797 RepID=UPI0036E2C25D
MRRNSGPHGPEDAPGTPSRGSRANPITGFPAVVPSLSPHQENLRLRLLAAPVVPAPAPWRSVFGDHAAVGGLTGVGFGVHPATGHDLVMVVSTQGYGVFDAVTGERIARDRDPEDEGPDGTPDLTCPWIGPLAGGRVRVAGLFGGGLHRTSGDGWSLDVEAPDWPHHRILLSHNGGDWHRPPHTEGWWHVFHSTWSTLRAAGFSPSGQTLVVATSSDLTLWTRRPA